MKGATLITGPSGSGKTSLSGCLRARGLHGVDADAVPGLCGWFDAAGTNVRYPVDAGRDFLENHRFLWRREILVNYLGTTPGVYLCGISRNVFDMLDLFDRAYFLRATPATLTMRLQSPSRDNPMGRSAYQREYSLLWAARNEVTAQERQLRFLDAEQPIETIADAVSRILPERVPS